MIAKTEKAITVKCTFHLAVTFDSQYSTSLYEYANRTE